MKMIETIVNVAQNHELHLHLPADIKVGQHKIILIIEENISLQPKETPPRRTLGLLNGQFSIPDNFNSLATNEINALFSGTL